MKTVQIKNIYFENFKSFEKFSIENCNDHHVYCHGTNGTGKTSVGDAITWCLFGTSMSGRSDLSVHRLTEAGEESEAKYATVEIDFIVDEEGDKRSINIKRVLTKKWSGDVSDRYRAGNDTSYYIDDKNVKKSEFDNIIDDLFIGIHLMIPGNFAMFPWKEKRQLLMDICEIDEKLDEKFSPLRDILSRMGTGVNLRHSNLSSEIDNHRRAIKNIQKKIDDIISQENVFKDLKRESLSTQKENNIDYLSVQNEIDFYRKKLSAIENQTAKQEIEIEIRDIESKINGLMSDRKNSVSAYIQKMENEKANFEHELNRNKKSIDDLYVSIEKNKCVMDAQRKLWSDLISQKFVQSEFCQMCNQPLPYEFVADAKENWSLKRANDLSEIVSVGKNAKTLKIKDEKEVLELTEKNIEIENKINKISDDINKYIEQNKYVDTTELDNKKLDLSEKLRNLSENIEPEINKLQNKIDELNREYEIRYNNQLAANESKKYDEKLKSISATKHNLISDYDDTKKILLLLEDLMTERAANIEKNLNEKFKLAEFKMFHQKVDGDFSETCEILYDGIPYDKGLNFSMQKKISMDIIQTLSQHYQVFVPALIDNSESIVEFPTEILSHQNFFFQVGPQKNIEIVRK